MRLQPRSYQQQQGLHARQRDRDELPRESTQERRVRRASRKDRRVDAFEGLALNALYNEIDPFAASWLRELIRRNDIAPGVVDETSIVSLSLSLERGQRHFFAGIGGWSRAFRVAGVPDDSDIWTGSCPCQPFSSASHGRGGGVDSPKHLWPAWQRLIAEHRPPIVFGEQVATGDGGPWFADVAADLEDLGYAVAAADLCSSLLRFAPRQRIFFVAHAHGEGQRARAIHEQVAGVRPARHVPPESRLELHVLDSEGDGVPGGMGQRRGYGNAINLDLAAIFVRAGLAAIAEVT